MDRIRLSIDDAALWRGAEVAGRVWVWPGVVTKREGVRQVAVGGWPMGQGKLMVRAIEVSSAVKDGAWGVAVCPSWGKGSGGVWDRQSLRDELTELVRAGRAANPNTWMAVLVRAEVCSSLNSEQWGWIEQAAMESGMDAMVEVAGG